MKQEDKELLLRDLCARLPYGVMIQEKCIEHDEMFLPHPENNRLVNIDVREDLVITNGDSRYYIEEIKPYLFPISSMTEEQWNNAPSVNLTNFTFESLKCGCFTLASYTCDNNLHDLIAFVNWLIKNHFDVNNLIPMGLAIDATNLNIY